MLKCLLWKPQYNVDAQRDIGVRTRSFAIEVMAMAETMRKSRSTDTVAEQVIRSATSAGANYREAKRARSKAEFISKTTIALQEVEETRYWLELIERRHLAEVTKLLDEADQLIRLLSASVSTAKRNNHR